MQIGAADHRRDRQAALDVGQLHRAERMQGRTLRVQRRPLSGELTPNGAPVEVKVPGQSADAPAVLMQDVQFHPEFSRLHVGPSRCWWL